MAHDMGADLRRQPRPRLCPRSRSGHSPRGKTPARFHYVDAKGRQIRDASILDRIRGLVIPPAWTDVWICPDATAISRPSDRDARGRKQYRYHPGWRAHRDEAKYHRAARFGRGFPACAPGSTPDLALPRPAPRKVLAAVVRLLEIP